MKVVQGKNTLINWRFSPYTGEPEVDSCLVVRTYPKSFLEVAAQLAPPEVQKELEAEASAIRAFFLRRRHHSELRLLNLKDLELTLEGAEFLVKEVLPKERLLELSK
ncbi:hypothetical protein J7J18_06510 [bacterium]|nr:hypothetical protein [bacterium]